MKQTLFQHDRSRKEKMTCHSWIAEGAIQNPEQMAHKLGILGGEGWHLLRTTFELKIYAILSF